MEDERDERGEEVRADRETEGVPPTGDEEAPPEAERAEDEDRAEDKAKERINKAFE